MLVDIFFLLVNPLLASLILVITRSCTSLDLILFEEIIFASLAAAFIVACSLLSLKKKRLLMMTQKTWVYTILLGLFISLFLLPNTLVNVDRSRSLYVLSWVAEDKIEVLDGSLIVRALSHESSDDRGVRLRLDEQIERGLITQSGNKFELTSRGEFTLQVANTLGALFNLQNWDLNKN